MSHFLSRRCIILILQRMPCGRKHDRCRQSDIYIDVGEVRITVRLVGFTSQGAKLGIDAPEHVRIIRADAGKKE